MGMSLDFQSIMERIVLTWICFDTCQLSESIIMGEYVGRKQSRELFSKAANQCLPVPSSSGLKPDDRIPSLS